MIRNPIKGILQLVLVMMLSTVVCPIALADNCPHTSVDRYTIPTYEIIVGNTESHNVTFWMQTTCLDCFETIADVALTTTEEPHQFEATGSGWVCKWCEYQTSQAPSNADASKPTVTPKPTATATPKPTDTPAPTAIPKPTTPPKYFKTEKLEDGTLIITGYTGKGGEVVIPDNIKGTPITAIGKESFEDKNITSLVIPEGVITIGDYAFGFNWDMVSVILPSTLKEIGTGAFNQCDILEVSLPEGLETIGSTAFGNNALSEFHIPASVTYIGGGFLADIRKVNFTIDEENKAYKIVDGALFSADGSTLVYYLQTNTRTEYTVPKGTIEIASFAFTRENTLKKVDLPQGLKKIGQAAFADCASLENITISSCIELEANVFQGCKALKEIVLPEGITSIRYATFSGCPNLETVVLPNSVTHIYSAFKLLNNEPNKMETILISGNVTYIGDDAFAGRENLTIVCPRNSYVWEFAKSHKIKVQAAVE